MSIVHLDILCIFTTTCVEWISYKFAKVRDSIESTDPKQRKKKRSPSPIDKKVRKSFAIHCRPRVHLSAAPRHRSVVCTAGGSSCDRCHAGERNIVIRPIAEVDDIWTTTRPYTCPKGTYACPQHRPSLACLLPFPIRRAKRNLLDNVRWVYLRCEHNGNRNRRRFSERRHRTRMKKENRHRDKTWTWIRIIVVSSKSTIEWNVFHRENVTRGRKWILVFLQVVLINRTVIEIEIWSWRIFGAARSVQCKKQ